MVKISNLQVFSLFFVSYLSSAAIFYPPQIVGENGWLSGLLATGYNLIAIGMIYIFLKKGKGKSLIELLNDNVFTKVVVISLIFFYLIILNTLEVTNLRVVVELILLRQTPVSAILAIGVGLALYGAYQGIEGIARMAPWILVLVLVVISFNVATLYPEVEFTNLQPLFPFGIRPSIFASFLTWDIIGFLFVTLLITPYINKIEKTHKALLASSLVVGIALVLQGIYVTGIFGQYLVAEVPLPVLQMVSYTRLDFIQSVEIVFLSQWIGAIFIKIMFVFWLLRDLLEKSFKLKDSKSLLLPLGFLVSTLSLTMFPNTVAFTEFKDRNFSFFAITIQFFLPLLLLPLLNKKIKA